MKGVQKLLASKGAAAEEAPAPSPTPEPATLPAVALPIEELRAIRALLARALQD